MTIGLMQAWRPGIRSVHRVRYHLAGRQESGPSVPRDRTVRRVRRPGKEPGPTQQGDPPMKPATLFSDDGDTQVVFMGVRVVWS